MTWGLEDNLKTLALFENACQGPKAALGHHTTETKAKPHFVICGIMLLSLAKDADWVKL